MCIRRAATLTACALLAACGDDRPALRSADGRYQVLACLAPERAADAPDAELWLVAARDVARVPAGKQLLVVGAPVDAAKRAVEDGRWAAASAFAPPVQAVAEVALLTALELDTPPQLAFGASYLTPANLASSGTPVFAPADFVLQAMRSEHAPQLHPQGQQQPVRFAVARAAGDDPWATAAERAPRLLGRLIEPLQGVVATPTDAAAWTAELQRGLDMDYRTFLVAAADPAPSAAARRMVVEKGGKVVLFSPKPADADYTHWVGVDEATLGRAAADALQQIRPEGARIVELLTTADPRHEAFAGQLLLKKP
ncbi:MAG: hypothetical protein H6835_14675 [Planctomycetes bacterium]|nr:hypothetical protein [Planctomycetota bacterium]